MSDALDLTLVEGVARAATDADGATPLDEETWLTLRHHRDHVRGLTEPVGFALVHHTALHVAVHPAHRGRGHGRRLWRAALELALADDETDHAPEGEPLTAWSHTDHPAARVLAAETGFERARELWVMRRRADVPLPALELPERVVVRPFRDGPAPAREADRAAVLRINAAAFLHHPEQGALDVEGFETRAGEPWWDPAGLLIAEVDGEPAAFHWTKQHSPDHGEVYVVGVDPSVQGLGLGRLVTLAGLHHLHARGVEEVLLYVESDNGPAIRVYRDKLGFTHAGRDTHVQYRGSRDAS